MSDDLLKAVGARVRSLRKARGASQEGFARMAEIDRAYLGRIERGAQNISVVTASRIAGALGTSLSSLFEGVPGDAREGAERADGPGTGRAPVPGRLQQGGLPDP